MNFYFDYTDNCNTLELRINDSLMLDNSGSPILLGSVDASKVSSVSLIRDDLKGNVNLIDITNLIVNGSTFVLNVSIDAPEPEAGLYRYILDVRFDSTYTNEVFIEDDILMYCSLQCCISKIMIKLANYKKDCFDPTIVINVIRKWTELMALIDSSMCGNVQQALNIIEDLKEFCENNDCYELIENCY